MQFPLSISLYGDAVEPSRSYTIPAQACCAEIWWIVRERQLSTGNGDVMMRCYTVPKCLKIADPLISHKEHMNSGFKNSTYVSIWSQNMLEAIRKIVMLYETY